MEKVQFLFFTSFLLVLKKVSFMKEVWAEDYKPKKFWNFLDIF